MTILGVDPGLQITGYGVVERKQLTSRLIEAGVVKTNRNSTLENRLNKIYKGISEVIKAHKPACIVLENLYAHYKHPTTAILMGHARGVICLAASESGVKVASYNPTRIKNAITGNGHASKEQVNSVVKQILGIKKKVAPFDVSDALAMALSFFHLNK